MGRRKQIIENMRIERIAAEGKCIGRNNGQVIFTSGLVPGDVADILITRKKSNYLEGKPIRIRAYTDLRIEPFCAHFEHCGGCKWQHVPYEHQLEFKQQQVIDNLERIGKVPVDHVSPILPSPGTRYYRNKLEFTFSSSRWLTGSEIQEEGVLDRRGIGFHVPGRFDRVVDIRECHLQASPSNEIRNAIRAFAIDNDFPFYDVKSHQGLLRNLIIRTTSLEELMVIVQFGANDMGAITACMDFLKQKFPAITSLHYIINTKKNDAYFDQEIKLWHGQPCIYEQLGHLKFKIGPKSFFQTNTKQAEQLYEKTLELAGLQGGEVVYDLYTGTGSIAAFLAQKAKWVVGIESVPEAIEDAQENARLNAIENVSFYAGDVKLLFDHDMVRRHGAPDVVVTDPPRAGMHKDTIMALKVAMPEKIVYVSCNPATQARDVQLLQPEYRVSAVQPVDMFPHTHHVENIILLQKQL